MTRVAGVALALMAAGCQTHDVGTTCEGMEIPFEPGSTLEGDVTRAQAPEVIEFDVEFPCEDPVCVITLGHGAYCSRECSDDAHCPAGFTCSTVMGVGPFEGYRFCVWRQCTQDSDCGDPWLVGCEIVPELSLETPTRLCAFRE